MFDLQKMEVKLVILAIVALVVLGMGYGIYYYHGKYEKEVTSNAVLAKDNAGLVLQIKADSDAVAQLATDAKARQDAAAAALSAAQKQARIFQKKAEDLLAATASNPNNLCLSADNLFNEYIGGK